MQRTDLDTPLLSIPSTTERTSSRFVRLTCSGILIISCTIFGFKQCYAQDVAEAARQEKARKENQQKKPKHVYTDEDLKRAQILTSEDRAEVEAKKNRQPVPGAGAPAEPVDAQAIPAELPLGDIARRYRRMREVLRLEQSAEFHLPFKDEPVFATPKPVEADAPEVPAPVTPKHPVAPGRPVIVIPGEPRIEPFQPPVKRSPFERPRIYLSEPSRSSANRATVPKAPAIGEAPSQPSTTLTAPSKLAAPAPDLSVMPSPRLKPHATPARPTAPIVRTGPSHASALSATPSQPSATLAAPPKPAAPTPDLRVMPSPRLAPHAMPARPAAPIVRNAPSRISALPAMPSKPAAPEHEFSVMPAPRLTPRTTPAQPAAPVVRATPSGTSGLLEIPSSPAAPAPDFSVMPSPKVAAHAKPVQPAAPVVRATPTLPSHLSVAPSQPAAPVVEATPSRPPLVGATPAAPAAVIAPEVPAKLNIVVVKPGDSLWKLAEENLGKGLRWREFLAVNPAIVDANYIEAGSQIFLPSVASSYRTATKIIVRKGDTLSNIAQTQLGRASFWSCIAHTNPAVHDANVIYDGQVLLLPASCKP